MSKENENPEVQEQKAEVYEGELVGYDLSALMGTIFGELQKAEEEMYIGRKTAFICATVLKDWYSQLAASGCVTIQLPEEL